VEPTYTRHRSSTSDSYSGIRPTIINTRTIPDQYQHQSGSQIPYRCPRSSSLRNSSENHQDSPRRRYSDRNQDSYYMLSSTPRSPPTTSQIYVLVDTGATHNTSLLRISDPNQARSTLAPVLLYLIMVLDLLECSRKYILPQPPRQILYPYTNSSVKDSLPSTPWTLHVSSGTLATRTKLCCWLLSLIAHLRHTQKLFRSSQMNLLRSSPHHGFALSYPVMPNQNVLQDKLFDAYGLS